MYRFVLGVIAERRVRLDDNAEVQQRGERETLGPRTGHVNEDLDEITAGLVPVHFRHFGDAHTGEPVRASLANGLDGPTTDPGVGHASARHFDARLDDIAQRPDPDRFARPGQLQVRSSDAWVGAHRGEQLIAVHFQQAIGPARVGAEHDVAYREGA